MEILFDLIELSTKRDIKVRPSKIIAGLEADKTNELLQAIAHAVNNKIDSGDAVATVKSGKVLANRGKETKPTKVQAKTDTNKAQKTSKDSTGTKRSKNDSNQTKQSEKKRTSGTATKPTKQSSKESTGSSEDRKLNRKSTKEKIANDIAPTTSVKKQASQEENDAAQAKPPEQMNVSDDKTVSTQLNESELRIISENKFCRAKPLRRSQKKSKATT